MHLLGMLACPCLLGIVPLRLQKIDLLLAPRNVVNLSENVLRYVGRFVGKNKEQIERAKVVAEVSQLRDQSDGATATASRAFQD